MAFDLDNLRVFLAAIEHGSFSAAARALQRVPSAVSMAIANLEAQLDVQLFERAGRSPVPTAQALALLPQARLLAEGLHRLNVHALALQQGLEASLTLALVPELLEAAPWSAALHALAREYPLLQVEVLTAPQADALAMVRSGRADLALVFERYGAAPYQAFHEVAEARLVAVAARGHPVFDARGLGPGPAPVRDTDLLRERQIVVAGREAGPLDQRIAMSQLQWKTDSPGAALALVKAGLGWAWLPSALVRQALHDAALVEIACANFTNGLRLYVDIVWTEERPLGLAASRFIELLDCARTQW